MGFGFLVYEPVRFWRIMNMLQRWKKLIYCSLTLYEFASEPSGKIVSLGPLATSGDDLTLFKYKNSQTIPITTLPIVFN